MSGEKNSDSEDKKIQEKNYFWILVAVILSVAFTVLANVLKPLGEKLFELISHFTFQFELNGTNVYIPWLGIVIITIVLISIRLFLRYSRR